MSKRPQIHIFVGAPCIPGLLEMSEQSSSAPAAENWRELCCLYDTHSLFSEKVKDADHLVFQAESSVVTTTESLIYSDFQIPKDRCTHGNVSQAADQHLPQKFAESARQDKQSHGCCSDLTERKASHLEVNSSDISDLVASTKQITIHLRPVGQGVQSDCRSDQHEHLSQYLDMFFPPNQELKPKGEPSDCSDFTVSTDTEFHSIMTSSQMAVFAQDWNEMQNRIIKLSETGKKPEERQCDHFQFFSDVGTCLNVPENECKEEYKSSLELFSSESDGKNVCFEAAKQEGSAQENTEKSQELNVPGEQFVNEICIEPLSSGVLCSQVDSCHRSSSKIARKCEDSFHIFHSAFKRQLKSKRAKLNSSPADPGMKVDQERMTVFKKLQKKLSPLKNCCSKNQKYNVLVTIVHPCHIKEIQVKSRPKSSRKVPVATIVVIDQSEIERKVVLWHGAAFWSLTVFPGDIVLLTDIIMYENLWCGEIMLQSTFASQLLNLGNCSALNPEEFYGNVGLDGGVLHSLLAYISSEFPHFGDIPQRQVQRLDSVQYMQLDQLQANTLVHSILKIINIVVLTESVYSYRGGSQRKIILTVEQNRDQHYRMVLWGAGAAWCPQLQRKKDHIWDFRYLLVQHSSVSGDFELHTTPWSSCECLFDDDKRAIEFKEKFQKSKASLMQMTKLSAHLEEKCSGVIQVKARILELKFTISTGQYKQLVFHADTSLECVLASLPMITYSGCAKCGLELQADENMIYKQCVRCLPYNKVKMFYRPALMTVEDGGYEIYVHVVSELMEKIFLNIPADWLNRLVVPSSDMIYSTIVADLCHLLLSDKEASYLLEIRSHFVLDENSYPLQKDFHLLDFHPDL
uniref:Shieldin complex subunit 2 n=1 Tax=Buteo japonicus TaxID=224669 RepID=A0A8C0BW54_9AVES